MCDYYKYILIYYYKTNFLTALKKTNELKYLFKSIENFTASKFESNLQVLKLAKLYAEFKIFNKLYSDIFMIKTFIVNF